MFSSPGNVKEALASVGYITDEVTATTVYLAAAINKPILLEGPPGSGKTQLAYAVAEAVAAQVERLQCYEGISEEKAIGKFDEALQRLAVDSRSKAGRIEWEALKQELHSQRFFSAGPLLRALQHKRHCVLLIDELDKVGQAFEAQAFKRACACFGLGRYFYFFEGKWLELDSQKRPVAVPDLPEWATPEGWKRGLRPVPVKADSPVAPSTNHDTDIPRRNHAGPALPSRRGKNVVRDIVLMEQELGPALYHGLLKSIARVWSPGDIREIGLQHTVLEYMEAARRGLRRAAAAAAKIDRTTVFEILRSLDVDSIEKVTDLQTLHTIVTALERSAGLT